MRCPNCQAEVPDGAAFCGACGASVGQAVAGATEPLPQPTVPMSGPDADAQAAYEAQMAEYERQKAAYEQAQYAQQMAEYERQKAAYDQQVYAQQQAASGVTAQPRPKKKTGIVIALVVILILLLVGCGVGGFFAYKALKDKGTDIPATDTGTGSTEPGDTGTGTDSGNPLDSYATAEEAVQAQLDASGIGTWVYQLYDEGDGYATYWAGPPNSEYVDEIYLEQNQDGSWSVIEVSSIDYGGDVSDDAYDAGSEAMWIVEEHLSYVMADDGLSAQSLTVDPFHSDSASAQVSAGGFDYYTVDSYVEQSDGTFWVQTTQSWYGSEERWEYWVVPTEAGYRIADISYLE
jgi:hypothetical protein